MSKSFGVQFDLAVTDVFDKAEAIYAIGCDKMFNRIIEDTPVDTGFARASWWKAVGVVGEHPSPPSKGSIGGLQRPLKGQVRLESSVFLANNTEYIERLEYGHSQQAPQGMVRVNLAESARFFDEARREVVR